MSYSPEEDYEQRARENLHREELVHYARAYLRGDGEPLVAINQIARIAVKIGRRDEGMFEGFNAVASEMDCVPTGGARQLWEPNALRAVEERARKYLAAVSEGLRADGLAILREFDIESES